MKDFFERSKSKSVSKKKSKHPVSSNNDVLQFLSKVASLPKISGDARLIFSLDATASRQSTWDVASQLQNEMFLGAQSLGGLNVQLCYFRGFRDFFNSDWQGNADDILRIMSSIQCQAGATQLHRLLQHAIDENQQKTIKCLIYIGDAMEEDVDLLALLAGKLGLLNVPLFMFQERNDPVAMAAFKELSRLSGGAYSRFDSASADQLKDLLRAVAIYAVGGLKALQKFSAASSSGVKLIEQQLRK